jgi:hypothetical protein
MEIKLDFELQRLFMPDGPDGQPERIGAIANDVSCVPGNRESLNPELSCVTRWTLS